MPRVLIPHRLSVVIVALLVFASTTRAELKLAALFSDHAVLQADMPVPVWGWAEAGQRVVVRISGGEDVIATAGADRKWIVRLPAMHASAKPVELTVTAADQTLKRTDILIGEVWLGSGQSNMAFTLARSDHAKEDIAAANQPSIRLFQVGRRASANAVDDVSGHWVVCSPESVKTFSAVLYHFGREINDQLKVPVGLIHSSWGGTPIQAWMPREAFPSAEAIESDRKRIMAAYPSTTQPTPRASAHLEPTYLYNGMIAPLIPYAMRGATWYQGENNVHQGDVSDYAAMMKSMVASWRGRWDEGEFPFIFVQIAPFGKYRSPQRESLPEMWEQQTAALSMIPESAIAPTGDVGNVNDIHPTNKRDVGHRLALIALGMTYKRPGVVYQSPTYKSHTIEGGSIRVRFIGVGSGLTTSDGKPPALFEIAGEDGIFHPAEAKIDGGDVVVIGHDVPDPKAARFAWSPVAVPNLINKEGLPAVAFRTHHD